MKNQPINATSIDNVASPRVHPATNDCYPLNKLCRLCLLSNINMEPIFSYPGDDHLAQKIFQCTNLEIKENADNGIPTSLCGPCKKQLDQCYEFRLLCWKNNEILHNLHAILSPPKRIVTKPPPSVMRANPVVQLEKLNLSPSIMPTPSKRDKPVVSNFGEVLLSQLYTPSRRGHKAVKTQPQFTKELVVRLSPVPVSLINKYKKATVTQTKAAMKSFPQSPNPRGRPKGSVKEAAKPVFKPVFKPVVKPVVKRIGRPMAKPKIIPKPKVIKAKVEKKSVTAVATKKQKAKRAEIAVPPKKRKENFETAPTVTTATCVLCTQAFNSVKSLSRHMATHENNRKNNRVFNCDVCNKEYLKASQLTDHLRSTDHIENAARNGVDEGEVSILPDESEAEVSILPDDADVSILPDDHITTANVNVSVESSDNPEQEPEEITDRVVEESERRQPSPDTNDNSQQNEPAQQCVESMASEINVQPEAEINTNRDASPIPVESESSRSLEGGVQYSDVCSTNNAENLLNGSGADPFNASRRVTFSDITEIVE